MDNAEIELKKAMNSLKANIEATTSCINDTDEIIAIITSAEENAEENYESSVKDLSKRLEEFKELSLQLENQKARDKKILSDYELGLAKLEREVNNRPD